LFAGETLADGTHRRISLLYTAAGAWKTTFFKRIKSDTFTNLAVVAEAAITNTLQNTASQLLLDTV
jgi:hypothetical protein